MQKLSSSYYPSEFHRLCFWSVLLFAFVVRFKDLATGLPLHSLYGENDMARVLLHMIQTGDLNPHQFDLPGLAYYLYLPFLYLFIAAGYLLGHYDSIASIPDTSLIFIGRCVCAVFGTASVYMIYRIGRLFSAMSGLGAMAILAALPQHIEFSHMLRPELPAIFFVLVAIHAALSVYDHPQQKAYLLFGVAAGVSFSIKYTIGLPLLLTILVAHFSRPKETKIAWLFQSICLFGLIFVVSNLFLLLDPNSIHYWLNRTKELYVPGEDYFGRNVFFYYLEFLSRYNYNLPLLIFAGVGLLFSLARWKSRGVLIDVYPVTLFLWLCSFAVRRTHGLLPLHPFLALWAGITMAQIWQVTREISSAVAFRVAYAMLLCTVLFWPYYRTGVQSYLLSRLDNRSKAELWMTNNLPEHSKIAVLQSEQVELDPVYFQTENFIPSDYVLSHKDFQWFAQNGFDYVVVSSGQYMQYFTEGKKASKYNQYFLRLFEDGEKHGTLVLDLITHPFLIPDYRIKVYSTRKKQEAPAFHQAIESEKFLGSYIVQNSDSIRSLEPGYYSLRFSDKNVPSFIRITNLKLNETILMKREGALSAANSDRQFPFSIFPERESANFLLFAQARHEIDANQPVHFSWRGGSSGIILEQIPSAVRTMSVEFLSPPGPNSSKPYLSFEKNESFQLRCALRNRSKTNSIGYVQAFLSEIGESQPWKESELAGPVQEFYLEPGQRIVIEISMSTGNLTGDFQLSYWIFTRQDVPFSPQSGGWFNKEIRVNDPKLGIHPIYNVSIP